MRRLTSSILCCLTFLNLGSVSAQQAPKQSFTDVPPTHPAYEAVEHLKAQGILTGYDDGSYKPERKVNRAEAAKIIVAPIAPPTALNQIKTTPFVDVAEDAWYLPFVEYARSELTIVDGPPKTNVFNPERTVNKAEFIKMLLLANKVDPASFNEIRLPFSSDVANTDEWYYPYMRYGIASSMTMISGDGLFSPGRELTRGDVALLLFRYTMYKDGRRTQALLSESETEIVNVLSALEKNDIAQAEYASARALIAARGANESRPNEPLIQAAVKIVESFRALVRAYRAGVDRDLNETIRLAGEAWNLAARAKELDASMAGLADQVQTIATNMAESTRALEEQQ
ncbi:MAG: S-layer homology domain-containing protein [Candidatus Peregrinibacteria bacterium]|nr:S-layer homology domain-containing protein [Candidatus Peregrinibacteria bacterium]